METIFKGIRMPKDVIDRVEKYQKENYISSFTQAVVQLLIKALEADNK